MMIHVSKDAENAINAAVQRGQFASADEMIDKLVREYAQRTGQQSAAQPPTADADPLLGSMSDHAELMDRIVEDAMWHREHRPWRLPTSE